LLARLDQNERLNFREGIVDFFQTGGVEYVNDQATLNAIVQLFPLYEVLSAEKVAEFINDCK
jgi:hypothetical protein